MAGVKIVLNDQCRAEKTIHIFKAVIWTEVKQVFCDYHLDLWNNAIVKRDEFHQHVKLEPMTFLIGMDTIISFDLVFLKNIIIINLKN